MILDISFTIFLICLTALAFAGGFVPDERIDKNIKYYKKTDEILHDTKQILAKINEIYEHVS